SDMFNYSTSATVYDQSGTPHMLTNYFVRNGATGEDERTWRVYTAIDGDYMAAVANPAYSAGPPPVGDEYIPRYYELVFNYNGTLDRIQDPFAQSPNLPTDPIGTWYGLDLHTTIKRSPVYVDDPAAPPGTPPYLLEGPVMVDLMRETPSFPLYWDDDNDPTTVDRTALPFTTTLNKPWFRETTATSTGSPTMAAFRMDLSTSTQFGIPFDVMSTRQDGYLPGNLSSISISQTGHLVAGYSNGQTKVLGQVLLAEFDNPHGLQSAGDNLWIETWDSGQPTIGNPGGGTRGIIIGQSVEESNVDMTQELVNMIIYQRNYQANAQTIRTQDQILQTLVNLR
ncbi:MAG: flagellar hook-basal body complex protein, partial [Zoogloeaceae bacterium]|nr:flagellar hook-basal body complex protein [Zoogloeaceae bacterium]